jgi:putative ABC transport system permease protein
MLRRFLARARALFTGRRLDEEFDEEARLHIELLQDRYLRQGMGPLEAHAAARRQFGGVTRLKQDVREQRSFAVLGVLRHDVRHACRRLRKSPRFTASAILTLALAIGAVAAVFAVLDSVVLKPLPYAEPDRLMAFRSLNRRGAPAPLSYPDFFDFRERTRVFDELVSYRDATFVLTDSQPAIQVIGEIVSWDLFQLLGRQPTLGRGFLREEEQPGTRVVVLSHALWTTRFGANPGVVGSAARINGEPFTIVGIAPNGFQFPVDLPGVQLWVPLAVDAAVHDQRGGRMLDAIGRLSPGVSLEQAKSQMDVIASDLAARYPSHNSNAPGTFIQPELQRITDPGRAPLWIVLSAVMLVLLIACANVAGLLLARCTERSREFALQIALGASRATCARSLLIESLTLAAAGAAAGLFFALVVLQILLPLAGDRVPRLANAAIDWRVIAFSAALASLTSVLSGLAPAIQASRTDPLHALKEGAPNIASGRNRFRHTLVVAQIALGLVLLVCAELMIAQFVHLLRRDAGFRPDHLLTFDVGVSGAEYSVERQIAFSDRLMERLSAIPGVQAVAAGRPLPLQGDEMRAAFDIERRPTAPADRPRADFAIVTPAYFVTMGIQVLEGRDFTQRDNGAAPPVVIVNRAFARRFFPGEDAIGRRIRPGVGPTPPPFREIIAVVGNAQQAVLGTEPDPICYFPYKQLPWSLGSIALRTTIPPLEVEPAARAAVAGLDPNVPVHRVRTGEELSDLVTQPARFVTVLMSGFAGIAVLLTAAGLYGVLSYTIARRRREIGVRIALGATRAEIVQIVTRRATALVVVGLILGAAISVVAVRLIGATMFGIPVGAPVLVAAGCGVLAVTSVLAAVGPAVRAASADPLDALRSE